MLDLTVNSGMLIEQLVDCASQRGMLIADDAPDEELANAQTKVDQLSQELQRRLAW